MRNVLVLLFWLWVLVAVAVYAYRIFRRVAHGPKRERTPTDAPTSTGPGAAADASSEPGPGRRRGFLAGLSTPPPPPLPDGPVEARLPRSLQERPPPVDPQTGAGAAGSRLVPDLPTLAEALQGIRMPEELLPVVDPADAATTDGRRARFAGTGTSVPVVATSLGEELKRLGYVVDGLDTVTSARAGLSAHRDGTNVAVGVGLDDDTGAVVVRLSL